MGNIQQGINSVINTGAIVAGLAAQTPSGKDFVEANRLEKSIMKYEKAAADPKKSSLKNDLTAISEMMPDSDIGRTAQDLVNKQTIDFATKYGRLAELRPSKVDRDKLIDFTSRRYDAEKVLRARANAQSAVDGLRGQKDAFQLFKEMTPEERSAFMRFGSHYRNVEKRQQNPNKRGDGRDDK